MAGGVKFLRYFVALRVNKNKQQIFTFCGAKINIGTCGMGEGVNTPIQVTSILYTSFYDKFL